MKTFLRKLVRPLVTRDIRKIIREMGDSRQQLRETPKNELIRFHRGLGMWLRNNFRGGQFGVLSAESIRILRERGEPKSFDGISSVALEQIWEELQQSKYSPPS
jgi:hypothetical protein